MPHIPPLLLLPLLLLLAAAAPPATTSAPITRAGLSLKLPTHWTADPPPPHTPAPDPNARRTLLVAHAPSRDTDDTGEYQAVLVISAEPGSSFDPNAQQDRLAHDSNFSNYQITEKPTPLKLADTNAVAFGGTFTLGPLKLRSRQYMLARNNTLYVVTFTCLESQWDTYIASIETSLRTLVLPDAK
ncbi:MAG TPA: hypothetical protein VHQ47_05070 [Phycisphaerae bacterium]|nr:hypothetical protein [Phycisphaerae bacterium]